MTCLRLTTVAFIITKSPNISIHIRRGISLLKSAAGMLLHMNGKFTMGKFKSSLLA